MATGDTWAGTSVLATLGGRLLAILLGPCALDARLNVRERRSALLPTVRGGGLVGGRDGQGGGSAGWGAEQGRRFGDDRGEGAGRERGRGRRLEIARGDCHGPGTIELLEDFLEVLECGGGHDIAAKGVLCLCEAKGAGVHAHEPKLGALGGEEGRHLADGGTTNNARHQVDRGRVGDDCRGVLSLGSLWRGVCEHRGGEID